MQPGDESPRRKQTRLAYYDYSSAGAYFITGSCAGRKPLFGSITDGVVNLSPLGAIAKQQLCALPERWPLVKLDIYVVMPNHFHMILWIAAEDSRISDVLQDGEKKGRQSVAQIIGAFKAGVTREARRKGLWAEEPVWQRSFYDHVIRDEEGLHRIRDYIQYNPMKWELDRENPRQRGSDPFYKWWSNYNHQRSEPGLLKP